MIVELTDNEARIVRVVLRWEAAHQALADHERELEELAAKFDTESEDS